jgi:hypothetical protein
MSVQPAVIEIEAMIQCALADPARDRANRSGCDVISILPTVAPPGRMPLHNPQ